LIINDEQKIGFNCITMPTFISAQCILAEMPLNLESVIAYEVIH